MQQRIEQIILKNLIHNEEYSRKVLPFLNKEYFIEPTDKILYEQVNSFINKYNNLPTKEALTIELDNTSLKEEEFQNVTELLTYLEGQNDEKSDIAWLLETTEKFCQDKAIYNAVVSSIKILDEPEKSKDDKGAIPELLTDALSVSFDPHVGHEISDKEGSEFERKLGIWVIEILQKQMNEMELNATKNRTDNT